MLKIATVLGVFLAGITVAWAQVIPPHDALTMLQIEELNGALLVLDRGSLDQCVVQPAKEKDSKAAPDRPCPFHKTMPLLKAMAQNIVALKPLDEKFKIEQNGVRTEVLAALPIPTGISDIAMKAIQGQQDIKYLEKMQAVNSEQPLAPHLAMIKMVDLDLGEPPEHNRIPAEVIAALAPIIEDLVAAK